MRRRRKGVARTHARCLSLPACRGWLSFLCTLGCGDVEKGGGAKDRPSLLRKPARA